jgi:hypothetical protein
MYAVQQHSGSLIFWMYDSGSPSCKEADEGMQLRLNLSHKRPKPTTEPNLNVITLWICISETYGFSLGGHYQMAIVSNTSATAETVERQQSVYQTGKVPSRNGMYTCGVCRRVK